MTAEGSSLKIYNLRPSNLQRTKSLFIRGSQVQQSLQLQVRQTAKALKHSLCYNYNAKTGGKGGVCQLLEQHAKAVNAPFRE